LLAPIP